MSTSTTQAIYPTSSSFLPEEICKRSLEVFGVTPKPEQIEVVTAMGRREDCILIAGCGWGKSIVYFLPLILWPDRTVVIISPLVALAGEQHQKLSEFGIKSIAIRKETMIDQQVLKALSNGNYRAVFLTPEIIFSSERIKNIWNMNGWRERLLAIVVDEAHCVSTWGGKFRKDYSRLGALRTMVPRTTPFLALSATLPPAMLEDVKKSLSYQQEVSIINVGNDRPNIKYVVAKFQHATNSFQDLNFLVKDFKKTIVYSDNRQHPQSARRHLHSLLDHEADRNKVACYHSMKSDTFKQEILQDFKDDKILVLLATEALGMGMDISNVTLVVQYGLPENISSLIQRLGRAARDPTLQGVGLLLAPPQTFQEPLRILEDKGLHKFVHAKSCRREVLNEIFCNRYRENTNCCDVCHPEPLETVLAEETPEAIVADMEAMEIVYTNLETLDDAEIKAVGKRAPRLTAEDKEGARQVIDEWRQTVFKRDYPDPSQGFSLYTKQAVMSDKQLDTLASKCAHVVAPGSISSLINWLPRFPSYMEDLTRVLVDLNATRQGHKLPRIVHTNGPELGDEPSGSACTLSFRPYVPRPVPASHTPEQPCLDAASTPVRHFTDSASTEPGSTPSAPPPMMSFAPPPMISSAPPSMIPSAPPPMIPSTPPRSRPPPANSTPPPRPRKSGPKVFSFVTQRSWTSATFSARQGSSRGRANRVSAPSHVVNSDWRTNPFLVSTPTETSLSAHPPSIEM